MLAYDATRMHVGATATFQRALTEADVAIFALITGSIHPLYLDEAYAANTRFARPIVPAALVGSIVNVALSQTLPGMNGLPRHQALEFVQPAYVEEMLTVSVQIEAVQGDQVTCAVMVLRPDGATVAQGSMEMILESLPDLPADPD